jgi:putative membrane protein insertion efficiency factor
MKIFSKTLIVLIKFYQLIISPYIGNNCRYLPTCSHYFIECLNEFGFFKGFVLGLKRILSCHPIKILGGGSGFDPIKKKKN